MSKNEDWFIPNAPGAPGLEPVLKARTFAEVQT